MRLVTWNCCRGAFDRKVPLLDRLSADVAVVQECGKPSAESSNCLWFGDNPRQGVAVVASNGYSLARLPSPTDIPKFMCPVKVTGPREFNLLAVWSKGDGRYPYIEGVVRGVCAFRALIESSDSVLIGDLNSNAIWDREHPAESNHSALVRLLHLDGLVSCYHHFFAETHGSETRPTYYFHWKRERPFHIDYCFVPASWASRIARVEVGDYDSWSGHSDHRPLLVDID